MMLIADSGSTKTDWVLVDGARKVREVPTQGFNPNYHSEETITRALTQDLVPHVPAQAITEIWYYGSGCWDPERKEVIARPLRRLFPNATVHIEHDLLGAARATCGHEPGIACILGTGSNSCLYDGTREVDNVTNLGFLLGDEGSGSHLGKELLRCWYYRELPPHLAEELEAMVPGGRKEVLDQIYRVEAPAVYLASFARFLGMRQQDPFVRTLVIRCFDEFLVRHVCKYEGHDHLPVHFVGSVAWHFRELLQAALGAKGLKLGVIDRKPIERLVHFHQQIQSPSGM
ncbi:MAG: hypothetical protein D6818_10420 [Bacteroidetes bacterium]|nr:MAG: hypothetical protein D6818_10420 [Bacteroidota bacterium]